MERAYRDILVSMDKLAWRAYFHALWLYRPFLLTHSISLPLHTYKTLYTSNIQQFWQVVITRKLNFASSSIDTLWPLIFRNLLFLLKGNLPLLFLHNILSILNNIISNENQVLMKGLWPDMLVGLSFHSCWLTGWVLPAVLFYYNLINCARLKRIPRPCGKSWQNLQSTSMSCQC